LTVRKSQLHVSATDFGHHQVVKMKTCQLAIHACIANWQVFICTTWWWPNSVVETCSCDLRKV